MTGHRGTRRLSRLRTRVVSHMPQNQGRVAASRANASKPVNMKSTISTFEQLFGLVYPMTWQTGKDGSRREEARALVEFWASAGSPANPADVPLTRPTAFPRGSSS